jgi:hypothetical protein
VVIQLLEPVKEHWVLIDDLPRVALQRGLQDEYLQWARQLDPVARAFALSAMLRVQADSR